MSANPFAALGEDGPNPVAAKAKAKPASHKEVTGGAKEKQYGAKGQQGDKKKHTSGKRDRTHHGKSSDHKGGAGNEIGAKLAMNSMPKWTMQATNLPRSKKWKLRPTKSPWKRL